MSTDGPLSIARLTTGSRITRQATTKHLHVLAGAGLVRDTRRGREHPWDPDGDRIEDARRHVARVSRQWDEALDRLKRCVEE